MAIRPFPASIKVIIPYQQEIKRERSAHLISPDMVTKESLSAKRDRRAAAGFLSVLYHILLRTVKYRNKIFDKFCILIKQSKSALHQIILI